MLSRPIPARPGCYVLLLAVEGPVRVGARTFSGVVGPGLYAYIGSAGGPVGLRARILRHLRRRKRVWWHVDWLTSSEHSRVVGVAYCESPAHGPPCEARAARCMGSKGYRPVRGFGSTDDPEAESHLYRAPPGLGVGGALRDALECLSRASGSGGCGSTHLGG